MKLFFISFAFLLSTTALAASNSETIKSVLEAQPYCQNFVRVDQKNIYLGFGPYLLGLENPRLPIPSSFRVAPLDGSAPYELKTNDSVIDMITMGTTAFVLTHSSIEEWNMATQTRAEEYPTQNGSASLDFKEHAEAMARYKTKLVIAHGRLGVTIFDVHEKKITNQIRLVQNQQPLESMATAVTIQGNRAYVVMDNYTPVPQGEENRSFRGIIVIDLDTEKVVAELTGMDPGADSVTSDSKNVIVSYMGYPLWKYKIGTLNGSVLPVPAQSVWRFPVIGHPTGAAAIDDKYYYTCFSRPPEPADSNGGVWVRKPMALDRRQLMLD